jgi:serine/threonine-protein kinase
LQSDRPEARLPESPDPFVRRTAMPSQLHLPCECPDWRTLADYQGGRLSADQRERVGTHVTGCTHCDAALVRLAAVPETQTCNGAPGPADRAIWPGPVTGGSVRDTVREARVGPYQLMEEAGSGGMGVVYRGHHAQLDRTVAVKLLRAGTLAGADAVARFRREAQALARLRHPHVVRLYEFGEHAGVPYFAMEWLAGGTLAARLAAGPLDPAEAARVVRAVAAGVEAAHGQNVLHRDLKPSNVLFAADGTPTVTDFGLAKLLDDAAELTASQATVGTVGYMAPEQAAGRASDISRRTDVYALGVVLYECLTGRTPFAGGTKEETLARILAGDPVPPSRLAPAVDRDLETICLACLRPRPAGRYATAAALADDLGRWLAGEPISRRPDGVLRKAGRWARRRAATLGVIGVMGVGSGIGVGIGLRPPADARETTGASAEVRATVALRGWNESIRAGFPAVLIGPTGPPGSVNWLTGGAAGRTWADPRDGSFSAQSEATGMLELLPRVHARRFSVRAEIRHDQGTPASAVGLYVGRSDALSRTGGDRIHRYVRLAFNGVAALGPARILPRAVKQPDGSAHVRLQPELYGESGPAPGFFVRPSGAAPVRMAVKGPASGYWYPVAVTVSPDGVSAAVDGATLDLPAPLLLRKLDEGLAVARQEHPAGDPVRLIRPEFTPDGGVGLWIEDATVSVRNVVVTPLPER